MIIILNGPLGIGKSTLAEALMESIDSCVMLSGDSLTALHPPPADELAHLHTTIALIVEHQLRSGYRHFVIEHCWRSPDELADLADRLRNIDPRAEIRCFLLTLAPEENIGRIERRQRVRAIDEREFELRTYAAEAATLAGRSDVGEPFDVSADPATLVARMLPRLGFVTPESSRD